MNGSKKVYYGPTTPQQRKLLMRVYQETDNVTEACRVAKVSRGTFYRWHPRFQEQGEAGLETCLSRAPHHQPRQMEEALAHRAIELHQSQPALGLRSVANLICQEHGYQRVISHEGVRNVWKRAHLSSPSAQEASPEPAPAPQDPVQRADCPEKTVNIDLCFIPREKLPEPAASPPVAAAAEESQAAARPAATSYPGQVFQRDELSYDEQMDLYAQGRKERQEAPKAKPEVSPEHAALQQELQEVRIETEELRQKGRKARKARHDQDQAWREKRQQRQQAKEARQKLSRKEKKRLKRLHQQEDEQWKATKTARQQAVHQHKQEQAQRKETRQELKKQEAELKGKLCFLAGFVAVLVVIDNCTRQCLGLPMFLDGRSVKANSIVDALKVLLPPELQYLISDNGPQFIAEAFQHLSCEMAFLHVRISPHRPQTNGIAERFVRTLKEMLLPYFWSNPEELQKILISILLAYNDRPHQGKGLNGLSPNELNRRLREAMAKAEQKCAA
jgi:transposase InsO family protein